jgi:hypothetical protein
MGKKKGNRSIARAVDRSDNKIVVGFKFLSNEANVSSIKTISLAKGYVSDGTDSSSRLLGIADQYTYFRFKKLKVTVYPAATSAGCCYVPANDNATAPSTMEALMEQPHSVFVSSTMTVPKSFTLNAQDMRGPFDWYRCSRVGGTTPDATEYTQGVLYVRASATETVNVLIEGVIEYKGAVEANVALERMKAQVLASLSSSSLPITQKK